MLSFDGLRRQLAQPTTSVQLGILGIFAGIASALVIILFRLVIAKVQLLFVLEIDDFTDLNSLYRIAFPIIGFLLLCAVFFFNRDKNYPMGIVFVIHWLKIKKGAMPLKNAIKQFIGGAVALISGFSVGREGPAVHLGASTASYVGNWLNLPYNSIRTLTGCGISAGIAASFNTPLAAVIFVMEVVFREYKIHVFIPIMLAAVVGALMTRMVFGSQHELSVFTIADFSGINYPFLVLFSIVISAVAYGFNSSLMKTMVTFAHVKIYIRLFIAAIITAAIGYFIPQALGSGMGAIQFAASDISSPSYLTTFGFIAAILLAKFITTVFALGMGVPGGVIGPVLGLGVLLGTLFGVISQYLGFGDHHLALYAVLGMAGLMAATLHSPLAALVALMELTANPDLITPAMLVIAVSYTVSVQVFGNRSIIIQQLEQQQLPYLLSPATQTLQKVGVLADLDRNYEVINNADDHHVRQHLNMTNSPHRLLVRNKYEMGVEYKLAEFEPLQPNNKGPIDSATAKIQYWPLQGISSQSTMAEAFELIQYQRDGAVYVYQDNLDQIIGIVHWQQLRQLLVQRSKLT